jgi:hypothetical protein
MFFSRDVDRQKGHVLLYIRQQTAAARLTALMTTYKIVVTNVSNPTELDCAVVAGGLDIAVTTTSLIALVRQRTQLPVINIEAFIFTQIDEAHETVPVKRFNGTAFLRRIYTIGNSERPF